MSMENIDELKRRPLEGGRLTYKLKNANVFVSRGGFHYIDTLDPVEAIPPEIDASQLTGEVAAYVETQLQANNSKFRNQAGIVSKYIPLPAARVLDIGCGGGLFLSLLKEKGAQAIGIELSDSRAQYAKIKHGLEIHKRPIEDGFWQKGYTKYFDAVTLWDVIEHVNFPMQALQSAASVLKPGGYLLIDTPCRDSFYYRFGNLTYRLSGGRLPTFLNVMYSSDLFGHKQIFATNEMKDLFETVGLEVIELRKFHELSFPYEFYLRKFFKSGMLVSFLLPLVNVFFKIFKIQNKMLAIGRKRFDFKPR